MTNFQYFTGTVTQISDFNGEGCQKIISADNGMGGTVHFIVSPSTYVLDQSMLSAGDIITGYYDGNAPVPLIYPPQYRALVVVKHTSHQNVKTDYFNSQLVSSDGQLQLNVSPYTQMVLTNGQAFTGSPANRDLVVIYGPSTKSIPAQTTPYKIVVLCLSST
ncbi:hypothetical protein [Cytobacillus firmus]|uniref:hypothetical protein n=1 Tax=Cytobacillus TaxID=2675230 RepID=UPI00216360D6|nr:hypothetical protein [Cytobacillus firmus]MCS0670683.1 hypothetical protein [Cytobacillus firmus]MCS0789091.1 hypothetical protein [Cytobacillus firmus]